MSEREKILRYYQANGNGELAGRLLDYAEAVIKNRKYLVSEFLDPFVQSITETITAHYPVLHSSVNGGYSGAERTRIAFVHEIYLGKVDFAITALTIEWDKKYYDISHRDVLGGLLGLGIKRDIVGDFVFTPEGCQVVLDEAIAGFVEQNLSNVGAAPVSVQRIILENIAAREEKIKEIRSTVPSLRLDVVAAAGFGTSRTKMSEDIAAQKVKVNWQKAKNSAQAVKAGDTISLPGRGRVELSEILGQTKKGRISVLLKRFI